MYKLTFKNKLFIICVLLCNMYNIILSLCLSEYKKFSTTFSLFDTGEARYQKLRKSVTQFTISQLGKLFCNVLTSKLHLHLRNQYKSGYTYITICTTCWNDFRSLRYMEFINFSLCGNKIKLRMN